MTSLKLIFQTTISRFLPISLTVISIVISLGSTPSSLFGQGSPVTIEYKDGQTAKGELLSVRDGSIVVSIEDPVPMYEHAAITRTIKIIKNDDIHVLSVKARKTIPGSTYGFFLGVAVIILPASFQDDVFWFGALVYGVLAGLVGMVIGGWLFPSSDDEIVFNLQSDDDLIALRQYARYRYMEPDDLKNLH